MLAFDDWPGILLARMGALRPVWNLGQKSSVVSRSRRALIVATSLGMMAAIACADLLTANINLSILYSIPLLLSTRARRRSLLWLIATACVALAYAGYLLGPAPGQRFTHWHERLSNYRMLNRTFAAIAILATAGVMHLWMTVHQRLSAAPAEHHDPNRSVIDDVLHSFEQLCAGAVCGLVGAAIVGIDLLTPRQFNLPILYIIPIVACTWLRSRVVLWSVLPLVLLATFMGYIYSPGMTPSIVPLLRNRALAACAAIAAALIIDTWIRRERAQAVKLEGPEGAA